MRKVIILIPMCLIGIFVIAQTPHKDYIKSKLVVIYIDDVSKEQITEENYVNLDEISKDGKGSGIFWKKQTNKGLQDLLVKLICSKEKGGDSKLQKEVRGVMQIRNKGVIMFMYNDVEGKRVNDFWISKAIFCEDSDDATKSWPCANSFGSENDWAGHTGVGAHYFNNATDYGTFIHELTHTQLDAPIENILSNNKISPYGNGGHYDIELIPSQNWAFNEGIANAFELRYKFNSSYSLTSWHNNNKDLIVDSLTNNCPINSDNPYCLEAQLKNDGLKTTGKYKDANAKSYKIRDLKPKRIMHNEYVHANILYQYMEQFYSTGMMVRDLTNAEKSFSKESNSFGHVFKQMVKSADKHKKSNNNDKYVPLAILDYYTGYKLESKADLEAAIGMKWTSKDTNIDEYFTKYRNVLKGFRNGEDKWDVSQISKFSKHVGVRK